MRISIENLLHDTTEAHLQQAFEPFGQVTSTVLVKDVMGRSNGCGFVEMPVAVEAQAAITGLDGQGLRGQSMLIEEAAVWAKGQAYFEYR